MGLTVRQIRYKDVEAAMQIDQLAFSNLQEKLSGQPSHLAVREREFFEFWRHADPLGALVAERDGKIIGINFNHARGRSGWFGPLAVLPEDQSAGAGKALLLAGIEYLRNANCRMIGLDTYPHNPVAVSMYLKQGFEIVGSTVQLRHCLADESTGNQEGNGGAARVEPIHVDDLPGIVATEEKLSGFNREKDFAFLLYWDQAFGLKVLEGERRIMGYLWGYRKRGNGVIGCLHVADEARYDEIGGPLVREAFARFRKLGLKNITALNDGNQSKQLGFLFRLGFLTQSTMVKLHCGQVESRRSYSPLASEKG